MKKSILVLGLSLALLVFSGEDGLSQASKEVTERITLTFNSTSKVLPLGEGSSFNTFEVFGILLSEEGKGLFHEATNHMAGSMLIDKGVAKEYTFYGYYLLKNGDKVFIKLTREDVKMGAPTKGKATIIGGTGKCTGIQGSWDYTGVFLRPAAQGVTQG